MNRKGIQNKISNKNILIIDFKLQIKIIFNKNYWINNFIGYKFTIVLMKDAIIMIIT